MLPIVLGVAKSFSRTGCFGLATSLLATGLISSYFNFHVAWFSLVFMWSPVVRSKHRFWAACYPVNMYCDRDISCFVIVTYHVLISVQFVSYVVII